MRTRSFLVLAAAGLVLRVALAPWAGHPFDTFVYYDAGQRMIAGQDFYGVTEYAYPPLWAGFLYVITLGHGILAPMFGARPLTGADAQAIVGMPVGTPLVVDWVFVMLEKIPLLAFDTLLAALLYRIVARRFGQPKKAQVAFFLFYLNPFVLWISSIWGTFDVIPTYFALLGTLLFVDKRGYASGLVFGVAIAFKYFPALILFSLLLGMRRSQDRRFVKEVLLATFIVLGGVSLPFLIVDAGAYLKGILSPAGGVFVGNLSVWTLLTGFGLDNVPAWIATLDILLIVALIALLGWVFGSRLTPSSFQAFWLDLSLLSLLLFYALFRVINDQYVFWMIPFLTLQVILGREHWTALLGVSSLVLVAGLVNVGHYSFFLPILTLSPTYLGYVLPMWNIPFLRLLLSVAFWLATVFLLWRLVQRVAGRGEIVRFLRAFPRSAAARLRKILKGAASNAAEPRTSRIEESRLPAGKD